jgi:hypothetical protein
MINDRQIISTYGNLVEIGSTGNLQNERVFVVVNDCRHSGKSMLTVVR